MLRNAANFLHIAQEIAKIELENAVFFSMVSVIVCKNMAAFTVGKMAKNVSFRQIC